MAWLECTHSLRKETTRYVLRKALSTVGRDAGNDLVQCFRDDGSFVGSHALGGGAGHPSSIAAWADGHAVLALEPTARVLLYDRNYRFVRELVAPKGEPLRDPSGVACLGDELLVLDRDASRVRSFGLDGAYRETIFDALEW